VKFSGGLHHLGLDRIIRTEILDFDPLSKSKDLILSSQIDLNAAIRKSLGISDPGNKYAIKKNKFRSVPWGGLLGAGRAISPGNSRRMTTSNKDCHRARIKRRKMESNRP